MGKDLFSVCPPPLKENLALQPPQVLIFSLKLQAFICRQRRTKHIDSIQSETSKQSKEKWVSTMASSSSPSAPFRPYSPSSSSELSPMPLTVSGPPLLVVNYAQVWLSNNDIGSFKYHLG